MKDHFLLSRQKMRILITCEEENHHHPFRIILYLYSCCSIVYTHRYAQLVHAHLCRGHAGLKRKSCCNMATSLGPRGTLVLPLVDWTCPLSCMKILDICLMNHQKTHQTNPMAPRDPPLPLVPSGSPVDPLWTPNNPIDPIGPGTACRR